MEPQEPTIATPTENTVESIEPVEATETVTPAIADAEPTKSIADDSIPEINTFKIEQVTQLASEILEKIKQIWGSFFGEGKQSNVTLAVIILLTIPAYIAASALLDILNKLPVLPSIFELVGGVYSVWFVYRYLLLANTRKELIDGITAWKNKVFG
jgi:uncharacterized phage infection (PIP) family protein YhgE